jgi:hypothetical protein
MPTITGGGSYDLTTTLAPGDNIQFLNTPVIGGTLTIETTALENTTYTSSNTTVISTGLGALIGGFQPGDTIVVRDLATDYAIFDHSPDAAAQNASVASELSTLLFLEGFVGTEVITISPSGTITDNLGLVNGDITSYTSQIDQALFGGNPQTASLFITIAADGTTPSLADAYITTDGEIVICYLQGTRILTPEGESPIEDLRSGDLVTAHSGAAREIKWIGRQSFAARFAARNRESLPVKIEAGALAKGLPVRDLYVSPGHSMLLDGQFVLARDLINGITITQPARTEDIHYYLIELETHDCVMAEGVWAETYADAPGLRHRFHNVAEFYARFPGYIPPDGQELYVPRPESGPALEARLRPVLARAGYAPGPLRGYIERIGTAIEGWAYDDANPEFPVPLAIFAGDEKLGEVLAHRYRGDLAAAGLGAGRCMFSFELPASLAESARAQLQVRRLADGAPLGRTPEAQRSAA